MKFFLLSLRIFKSYKILSVLLCFEMIFGLFVISTTSNSSEHLNKELNIIDSNNLNNSMFFMGRIGVNHEKEVNGQIINDTYIDETYKDDMLTYLDNIDEFLGMSSHTLLTLSKNDTDVYISSFDSITSQKLKCKTVRGKWYTDVTVENGRIPCVVMDTHANNNSYKIGDVIKGYPTVEEKKSNSNLEFEVVGIVDRMNSIVLADGSSYVSGEYIPPLNQIFSRVAVNTTTILCGDIPSISKNDNMYGILYFNDNIKNDKINEIYTKLSQYGSIYKISDMYHQTQNIIKNDIKSQIPIILLLIISIFIGLVCISVLNAKKQLKTFNIYNLCGSNWKKSLLIYFIYFLTLLFFAFITFAIIMNFCYMSDKRGVFYLYYLSSKTIMISLSSCILISLCSTIIPFINAKSNSFISNYKTFN